MRKSSYIKALIVVLIVLFVVGLHAFVVQNYKMVSGSMEEALLVGDLVLCDEFTYIFRDPKPGDIIGFKYPLDLDKNFIKRCVAVEGQVVEIKDTTLYVDGVPET